MARLLAEMGTTREEKRAGQEDLKEVKADREELMKKRKAVKKR
jgi:hypothetical protein